jgi:hypothetical protein
MSTCSMPTVFAGDDTLGSLGIARPNLGSVTDAGQGVVTGVGALIFVLAAHTGFDVVARHPNAGSPTFTL